MRDRLRRLWRRPLRLGSHLALIAVVALVPVVLFAVAMIGLFVRQERRVLEHSLRDAARTLSLVIDTALQQTISALEVLALSGELARGDLAAFYREAQRVAKTQPTWLTVALASPDAEPLVHLRRPFGSRLPPMRNRTAVLETARTRAPVVSGFLVGTVTGRPVTVITVPVMRDDRVTYVVAAVIDSSSWQGLLVRHAPTPSFGGLIDRNGVFIARARDPERFVGAPASDAMRSAIAQRSHGSVQGQAVDGFPAYGFFHTSTLSGWTVALTVPASAIDGRIQRTLGFALGGFAVLLAIGGGIAFAAGRRIGASIGRLGQAARVLGTGATPVRRESRITEVAEAHAALAAAATVLADRQAREGEAHEALARSEARFRTFFDNAEVGTVLMGLDGRWLAFNDRYCEITGYRRDELMAMNVLDLSVPEERDRDGDMLQHFLRGATSGYDLEKRYVRKDGAVIWVHITAGIVRDPGGRPLHTAAVVQDITARKRIEQELVAAKLSAEESQTIAEDANRAKDHFMAVLSHELRTPLTPVLAGVSMLQKDPTLSDSTRHYLDVVRRNVELESRLIDDLLDLTRIARGKVELDRRRVELCGVLDRAVEVCRPDIEARGLALTVDHGAGSYPVDADAGRLQQVFWNLLENAVKFTPRGGTLDVRCRADGDAVLVQVADSGVGIEPSDLDRIFEPFAQAERPSRRRFGGLGLGLAISKALVERHGGTIAAASDGHDTGATFTVRLPTAPAADAVAPPGAAAPVSAVEERRQRRILLVEDHHDTANVLRDLLTSEGHQVETAATVAGALQRAARGEFDVLVSDLGLPDGSGLDLLRALRARGRALPGIAITGYGQDQDVERSRAAGFELHLVKPVDPARLLEAIDAIAAPRAR